MIRLMLVMLLGVAAVGCNPFEKTIREARGPATDSPISTAGPAVHL
jgi:hypothetical protein